MPIGDTIVYLLTCVLLPPLAVYFKRRECDQHVCVNVVLTFLAWIPGTRRLMRWQTLPLLPSGHGQLAAWACGTIPLITS